MNSTSDAESNSGFLEEIASVVTVIRDGDDRVLLASSSNDGPWSCLGGAVRSGESLEDAARRYPQEDCGVTVELRGVVANLNCALIHSQRDAGPTSSRGERNTW
jgi:predicted NUDIX family NTP pyrophosphohydrolase